MLTRNDFAKTFGGGAVFGVVHLRALPGAPLFGGSLDEVIGAAVFDAQAIARGGAAGIVIENFGDRPFSKLVGAETVAAMTRVVSEIQREVRVPIGVNVLRNDVMSALAIAVATEAAFVRVNILTGAMVTDQGIIEGDAGAVMRRRRELGYTGFVFADHMVKHAVPLGAFDPVASARDLRSRAMADALIVTGVATGSAPEAARFREVRGATDAPILIGSGLTEENAAEFRELAEGAIVGTSIKKNGRIDQPVDAARVASVVKAFRG